MRGPGYDFLACGCQFCVTELHKQFAQIVLPQFSVAEEKTALLLALREVAESRKIPAYAVEVSR